MSPKPPKRFVQNNLLRLKRFPLSSPENLSTGPPKMKRFPPNSPAEHAEALRLERVPSEKRFLLIEPIEALPDFHRPKRFVQNNL